MATRTGRTGRTRKPDADRYATLSASHHLQALAASGRDAMRHDQLSALYAEAHALTTLMRATGDTKELRLRLAQRLIEIADVRKGLV